jgi:polysaccharide biosynthesis protein PslG
MTQLSRRSLLKTGLAAAGAAPLAGLSALPQSAGPLSPHPAADFGWPALGKLAPRPSLSVNASPLSIGFETLDRKVFEPEKTYAHLAALGVKWARCQTGWARTERRRGEYDFAWLDGVVDSLLKIGVQPWFNFGYGNKLYTPEAATEYAVGFVPLYTADARAAWVKYTQTIAERYRARVRHWEIWNEPNIPNFWQPTKPNPADYVELVKLTAPEIRRRVPNAVIIGGSLASMPIDYLEQCLEAGLAEHVDKISYHPYRPVPEANYESEVRAFRSLIARYKPGLELWQSENGSPSANGGCCALANFDWDETRQAKWLLRRILTDLSLRIELTSYFHTVDLVNYTSRDQASTMTNYKGVLRGTAYTPKPSYFAYQHLCSLFDAETRAADLIVRSAGVQDEQVFTAGFVRRGAPLFARWMPSSLQQDKPMRRGHVELWSGKSAKMTEPVLVDLLSGQMYKPGKANFSDGWWKIEGLPLTDYPLVVTDRSVVQA